jgi:hypothetical protein
MFFGSVLDQIVGFDGALLHISIGKVDESSALCAEHVQA